MSTSSLIKHFSGHHKMESLVWKYFEEQADIRQSKCQATDLKGRISGNLVEGKNAANLKSHSAVQHLVSGNSSTVKNTTLSFHHFPIPNFSRFLCNDWSFCI